MTYVCKPLANIKAVVSLLKKVEHKQVEPFIHLLAQSTEPLYDILNGLTDSRELTHKNETTSIWELETTLSAIKLEFIGQMAQIEGEIVADFSSCPAVSYLKSYLGSLFRNMISNAIKYRAANRTLHVVITSYRKDGFGVITFQDNGIGIDLAGRGHKL